MPVFWLEGEDHDFEEMHYTQVPDSSGAPVRIEYLPGGVLPDRNPGPVGEMRFDASLATTLDALKAQLQPTEFTEPLMASLRECYAEGASFNEAFARWVNRLFPDDGLVFISANHPSLKKLLSPLFLREITEFPASSQIVIEQSAELEKTYHAQVKPKSINLFLFHKGGRYSIEPRENDFSLRGTRHFLTPEELAQIARETPELLSPNVILRPLAQDTLLPTVAYVAGPSEIAYHAQITPLYAHFGIPQPVLFPRASATIVEERVRRVLEKYSLEIQELYGDPIAPDEPRSRTDLRDQAGRPLRADNEGYSDAVERVALRTEGTGSDAARCPGQQLREDRRESEPAQGEKHRGPEEAERDGRASDRARGGIDPPRRHVAGTADQRGLFPQQVRA